MKHCWISLLKLCFEFSGPQLDVFILHRTVSPWHHLMLVVVVKDHKYQLCNYPCVRIRETLINIKQRLDIINQFTDEPMLDLTLEAVLSSVECEILNALSDEHDKEVQLYMQYNKIKQTNK